MFEKLLKEKRKDMDTLHEQRLARCVPVAKEVLSVIASNDPYLGDLSDKKTGRLTKETEDSYMVIGSKIMEVFLKHDILFSEREYIFQLVNQAIEQSKSKVINSMNLTMDRAIDALLGKDQLDVTVSEINLIVKAKLKNE